MCPDCAQAASNPHHGGYSRDCLDCAARAYINAMDGETELEYFSRWHGAPDREDILARVKELSK